MEEENNKNQNRLILGSRYYLFIGKMYIYPLSVSFNGSLYGFKSSKHGQIWYLLIDNFTRNNFEEIGILRARSLVFEKNRKKCKERLTRAPKMWFYKGWG